MVDDRIIKVTLQAVYEYRLSDLYSSINEGDHQSLDLSKERVSERAVEEASSDFLVDIGSSADSIEDLSNISMDIKVEIIE